MKTILRLIMAMSLLLAATSSNAWFGNDNGNNNNWGPFGGNNNNWGPFGGNGWGNNYNPYDEWDPRYWMEEMENAFDSDDGYYGPPPGYYGGSGPYGSPQGYYNGPRPYGPPPGYAPPQFNGPNSGPRSYGPPPGYRQGPPPGYRGPAPQQVPPQQ